MRAMLLLLLLTGCDGGSAIPVMVQGRPAVEISCNGSFNSVLNCYKKAGEACPTGYQVMRHEVATRDPIGDGDSIIGRIGTSRSLVVRCAA